MSARVCSAGMSPIVLTLLTMSACTTDADPNREITSQTEVAVLVGAGPDTAPGSCAVASCHGAAAEAGLNLKSDADLATLLVGVPACEAPNFKLVEPGDPERSWLWIKLTAPMSSNITGDLKTDPSWGEPGKNCGGNGFGKRMPRVSPYTLSADELAKIRAWIEAGAPGLNVK